VAIAGSTVVVGAEGTTVGATTIQGAVYVESYGLTNGSACSTATACGSGNCLHGAVSGLHRSAETVGQRGWHVRPGCGRHQPARRPLHRRRDLELRAGRQ